LYEIAQFDDTLGAFLPCKPEMIERATSTHIAPVPVQNAQVAE